MDRVNVTNNFDSPDHLIGDEGIATSFESQTIHSFVSDFQMSLLPPKIPADFSLTPMQQWQKFCAEEGKEWWQAWQTLSRQSLVDYIKLIAFLPTPFLGTLWLNDTSKGSIPYQKTHLHHQGITAWMLHFTQPNIKLHPSWADYRPFGMQAMALLNLCRAVYEDKTHSSILRGERNLFISSEHLWFWCIVALCLRALRSQGLTNPLLSNQLQSKQTILTKSQAVTELWKQGQPGLPKSICEGWEDFIEHLDLEVMGEAVQEGYLETGYPDPLESLVQVHEHTRNIFRRSEQYQAFFLYQFPEDSLIRTFITGQGMKLPKPRRQRKRKMN